TMSRLIKEMLPRDVRVSKDTQDLLMDCCLGGLPRWLYVSAWAEFINLISSEANEICSKEDKRTIAPEHVLQALESLGFSSYLAEVQAAYDQHKSETLPTVHPIAPLPPLPALPLLMRQVGLEAGAAHGGVGAAAGSGLYDMHLSQLSLSALHSLPTNPPSRSSAPLQESPRALGRSSSSKASGPVGMSEEEAIAEQQKMFAEARAAMLNLQRPPS
ncbi:unnamed protein product, partial [Closterium sp. Naga37s-1]